MFDNTRPAQSVFVSACGSACLLLYFCPGLTCFVLSYLVHATISSLHLALTSQGKDKVKAAKDKDKATGSRKSPAAVSGRKQSNSAKPPGGRGGGMAEAKSKMRAELEDATRRRNEFLSERCVHLSLLGCAAIHAKF